MSSVNDIIRNSKSIDVEEEEDSVVRIDIHDVMSKEFVFDMTSLKEESWYMYDEIVNKLDIEFNIDDDKKFSHGFVIKGDDCMYLFVDFEDKEDWKKNSYHKVICEMYQDSEDKSYYALLYGETDIDSKEFYAMYDVKMGWEQYRKRY